MNGMDTSRWTQQIDAITDAFFADFGSLPQDVIFRKPAPDAWSIGENIAHIIRINESYYPILDALMDGSYRPAWTSKFGFIVRFFGDTVLKSVNPDRSNQMKTFPLWEPQLSEPDIHLFEKFKAHQSELKSRIEGCSTLLDKGTIINSPANKYLVYKLETAFDIIVTHEKRHYEQCADTLRQISGHTGG
jgi:hypothetical protein